MGGKSSVEQSPVTQPPVVPRPVLVKYNGSIKLEFDAYEVWKGHTGNFEFFFAGQNDSKLCLCKTDDPEGSCIVIELKVCGCNECFVQCKKYNRQRTPLPERQQNTHENWNLGTALYACHTFASRHYSSIPKNEITTKSFAQELVRYMVGKGPGDQAIQNPIGEVKDLMKWSTQLDIKMNIFNIA